MTLSFTTPRRFNRRTEVPMPESLVPPSDVAEAAARLAKPKPGQSIPSKARSSSPLRVRRRNHCSSEIVVGRPLGARSILVPPLFAYERSSARSAQARTRQTAS
jgi:hypothetical protein